MAGRAAGAPSGILRGIDRLNVILAVIGGVACALLAVNVVIDVLVRASGGALAGTLDLTTHAWMPTLISLGMGYALLQSEHIRVNLLTGPTPQRVQRVVEIVAMAFTCATVSLLIYFSVIKAGESTGLTEHAVGTTWIPVWPFRWVVVLGLAGLALQALAQVIRVVRDKDYQPDDEIVAVLQ